MRYKRSFHKKSRYQRGGKRKGDRIKSYGSSRGGIRL